VGNAFLPWQHCKFASFSKPPDSFFLYGLVIDGENKGARLSFAPAFSG
jgi:hypothetical protein